MFNIALFIWYSSHVSKLFTFFASDASANKHNAPDIWMRHGQRDRARREMKASVASITPNTSIEKTFPILSRLAEPGKAVPALLMKTSIRPSWSETVLTAVEIEASFSTSS